MYRRIAAVRPGQLCAAQELDRTRTYLIEKAIIAYFDTLDEMVSDQRIDEVKKGNVEVYSLDEVAKQLGLD